MMVGVLRRVRITMSAIAQPATETVTDLSENARDLANYLEEKANEEGGVMYVKGKFIADDVGYSPKEIGQLMSQLQDLELPISVEPWSYTGATTWQISVVEST